MKKNLTLFLTVVSIAAYSQISIPATSSKGVIVTQNNDTIVYKDLRYEKGKVTYKNVQTEAEEFLYDNSVKSIEENENATVVQNSASVLNTQQPDKLISIKDIKNHLKENDVKYKRGKSLNDVGTVFVIGGGAAFMIGGISNLSKTNEINNGGESKKGSSTPLIIGLVAAGAGVVMKIAGHSQMKNSINNYQNADTGKFNPNYYVVNDGNGVGMIMKF
ncbi:hypothetical protein ACM39_04425 [Chryseobacterium sp. FH2]|uniref:hypothetical protein n=1 Tax=Chryseobacterium sp. FH2 TaxID=1674291 RepID=UPI00065AC8F1|nr:hypothetical protein [Chryseobacterium sp. FH2]KMQ69337.1 hypothetical protein ACM39_04425 [Chryseobacterium sp. FH2]